MLHSFWKRPKKKKTGVTNEAEEVSFSFFFIYIYQMLKEINNVGHKSFWSDKSSDSNDASIMHLAYAKLIDGLSLFFLFSFPPSGC